MIRFSTAVVRRCAYVCMSPVSLVFHTVVTVSIGLINLLSESIQSTILDVHVLMAEHQNSPFLSVQLKLSSRLNFLQNLNPCHTISCFFSSD